MEHKLAEVLYEWLPSHEKCFQPLDVPKIVDDDESVGDYKLGYQIGAFKQRHWPSVHFIRCNLFPCISMHVGEGNFGKIHNCFRADGKSFALKKIPKTNVNSVRTLTRLCAGLEVLSESDHSRQHPNILYFEEVTPSNLPLPVL